jgi:hypothetical protein
VVVGVFGCVVVLIGVVLLDVSILICGFILMADDGPVFAHHNPLVISGDERKIMLETGVTQRFIRCGATVSVMGTA